MEAPERIIAWAWENDRGHGEWDVKDTGGMPYVRYDLAQAPAPVRVKKLVWLEKPEGQDCRIGRCDRIAYAVERHGKFWGFRRGGESGLVVAVGAGSAFSTEAEAMAGADRDHVKRILAALEAPDAGVVAELVEAAKALSDAYRTWSLIPRRRAGEKQAFEQMHLRKVALDAALTKLGVR